MRGWMMLSGLSLLPALLAAQVGHDPGRSPYHDLRRGPMLRVVGGYLTGGRGKLDVGPTNGATGGLRLEYQVSNVLVFTSGIAYARTNAFYVTALETPPDTIGPVDNRLVLADLGIQLSLTGGKTVRGFQPFIGGTVGLVFGSHVDADSSGYDFGTRFSGGPEAGVRWYPVRRLSVELGGRVVFFKLQYPRSFQPVLLPFTAALSEWTAHPWATVGVAWTF